MAFQLWQQFVLVLYVNVRYDLGMNPPHSGKTIDFRLTIGELAEELSVTTRTIRYYEERGMISPGRTEGGQRFYTRRERGRLKLILRGKAAGFAGESFVDGIFSG